MDKGNKSDNKKDGGKSYEYGVMFERPPKSDSSTQNSHHKSKDSYKSDKMVMFERPNGKKYYDYGK